MTDAPNKLSLKEKCQLYSAKTRMNPKIIITDNNRETLSQATKYFNNQLTKKQTPFDLSQTTSHRIIAAGNKGIIVLGKKTGDQKDFRSLAIIKEICRETNKQVTTKKQPNMSESSEYLMCQFNQKRIPKSGLPIHKKQELFEGNDVAYKFGYTDEEIEFQVRIANYSFTNKLKGVIIPILKEGIYNNRKVFLDENGLLASKCVDNIFGKVLPLRLEYFNVRTISDEIKTSLELNPDNQPFTNEETITIIMNVLYGLCELEECGIHHHRDLHGNNILINTKTLETKIIDIGEATTNYDEPVKIENRYRGRNDYDSLAQLAYNIATGEYLFNKGMNDASKSKTSDEYYSQFRLNFEYEDSALHLKAKAKLQRQQAFKEDKKGKDLKEIITKLLDGKNHHLPKSGMYDLLSTYLPNK
jgi:serine/threonine protein kinase